MRKLTSVVQLSLSKWGPVLALVAAATVASLPERLARAETSAQKNANVGAFDVIGIKLGMSRAKVEDLLKAKIEAGKVRNITYEFEKASEPPYEIFEFNAAKPGNTETTHLTVYFPADQKNESPATLIYRRDKTESISAATFYESLVKKYGAPTFESKGRQELIWSENAGKRCSEDEHLLRSMKDQVTTGCGKRLLVSLGQRGAITGFEMVLKDESVGNTHR